MGVIPYPLSPIILEKTALAVGIGCALSFFSRSSISNTFSDPFAVVRTATGIYLVCLILIHCLYMQKPVAFFDVDGTLFRSSLLIELVEELVREGVFPHDAHTGYAGAHAAWLAREGTYDNYIQAVIDTFLTHIKGVHYGALADVGRRVVALKSKRVYTFTRDYVW